MKRHTGADSTASQLVIRRQLDREVKEAAQRWAWLAGSLGIGQRAGRPDQAVYSSQAWPLANGICGCGQGRPGKPGGQRPSRRLSTWPKLAAAMGLSSRSKTSSAGRPSSADTMARAVSEEKGGTRSWDAGARRMSGEAREWGEGFCVHDEQARVASPERVSARADLDK